MALRAIRMLGDEILTKPCREVTEMTPRLQELIGDMLETMYDADGVGLAAPQVGVLRQILVIDIWQDGVRDPGAPDEAEEDAEETDEGRGPETAQEPEAEAGTGTPAKELEAAQEAEAEAGTGTPADVAEAAQEPEAEAGEADEEEFEEESEGPLIMVNPVITRKEGEQTADEGCLSLPGKVGQVTRPYSITVTYFDENMDEYELDAEGLLARAICHEVDHLSGHMYVEFVEGEIHDAGYRDEEEESEEEPGEAGGEGPGEEPGEAGGEEPGVEAGEAGAKEPGEAAGKEPGTAGSVM